MTIKMCNNRLCHVKTFLQLKNGTKVSLKNADPLTFWHKSKVDMINHGISQLTIVFSTQGNITIKICLKLKWDFSLLILMIWKVIFKQLSPSIPPSPQFGDFHINRPPISVQCQGFFIHSDIRAIICATNPIPRGCVCRHVGVQHQFKPLFSFAVYISGD